MSFFWRNLFFNTYFELCENLFRTFGEFFLCRFVTLALCLPRRTSSVKNISLWNCFNNCVEWSVLGKKHFAKELITLHFLSDQEQNYFGRLARKLGAGLLKVHSTGPVNLFPWNYFFGERSFLQFFSGLRVKHLRSFGKNFLTVLSKLHSSCWKDFLEEKEAFWKKDCLYECYGNLSEENRNFGEFFSSVVTTETYVCTIISRGKMVFWEKNLYLSRLSEFSGIILEMW